MNAGDELEVAKLGDVCTLSATDNSTGLKREDDAESIGTEGCRLVVGRRQGSAGGLWLLNGLNGLNGLSGLHGLHRLSGLHRLTGLLWLLWLLWLLRLGRLLRLSGLGATGRGSWHTASGAEFTFAELAAFGAF